MAGRHLFLGVASGRPVKPHYALPRPVRLYGYVSLHAMIARLVLPRHRCDGIAHVPHPSHIQPKHTCIPPSMHLNAQPYTDTLYLTAHDSLDNRLEMAARLSLGVRMYRSYAEDSQRPSILIVA